ncbi:MAG: FAD-dependent oxidoreductase [Haliea sp.]|nr:FAD-dependent oxidoreductase [Haliea sp.]
MTIHTEAISNTGNPSNQFDCIIVGAGHNGLATALVLARNGRRVLVLEKTTLSAAWAARGKFSKGVATRWARVAFPAVRRDQALFRFRGARGGDDSAAGDGRQPGRRRWPPVRDFQESARLSFNLLRTFGLSGMLGFIRLLKFCQYPARVLDRFTARKAPRKLEDLIAEAATPGAARAPGAGLQGLGDGYPRQIFSRSGETPGTAREHGVCRRAGDVQGALYAGLRVVPDLHDGAGGL